MLSTYYYIYILVDTYYVINGITIFKYLHTDNAHNGGNANYMSTLCPTVKGVYVCVLLSHHKPTASHHKHLVGQWVDQSSQLAPTPRVSIDWV